MNNHEKLHLVLLPGFDGTGLLFNDFINKCPPEFTTEVIKIPSDGIQTYENLEERIHPNIPNKSRIVLLGESFSGPLATKIAANQNENIIGLILVSTFIKSPKSPYFNYLPINMLAKIPIPICLMQYLLLGKEKDIGFTNSLKAIRRHLSPDLIKNRMNSILTADETENFLKVKIPIIYFRALHDKLIGYDSLKYLITLRPDIIVEEFETEHLLLQTAPKQSWDKIKHFCEIIGAL